MSDTDVRVTTQTWKLPLLYPRPSGAFSILLMFSMKGIWVNVGSTDSSDDAVKNIKKLFANIFFSKKSETPEIDLNSVEYRYHDLKQVEDLAERRVETGELILIFFDDGVRHDLYTGEEIKCDRILFCDKDDEPSVYGVLDVEEHHMIIDGVCNLDDFPMHLKLELTKTWAYDFIIDMPYHRQNIIKD